MGKNDLPGPYGPSRDSAWVTRRTAFFLIIQALFLTIYIFSSSPSPSTQLPVSHQPSTSPSSSSLSTSTAPKDPCTPDYISVIQSAHKSPTPPQLSVTQLIWIKTLVQTSAYLSAGRQHNFLVWGLGYDSPIWENANCVSGDKAVDGNGTSGRKEGSTRTVFVENWRDWIEKVSGRHPGLEVVQFDKYDTNVKDAEKFMKEPYLLPLPDTINEECWDVVLVDAPQGYEPNHPGRHAPTYWSVSMAHSCLKSNPSIHEITIFLHDVNRPLEQQIIDRILRPNGGVQIGRVEGGAGTLVGFRFTRESLGVV